MRFARVVFALAALYGLAVLPPHYWWEQKIGQEYPPAITHPEFFYGFVGVAIVFQLVFLLIAYDPQRYRPLMLLGVLEKVSFGVPVLILVSESRSPPVLAMAAGVDLCLGFLFLASFVLCPSKKEA